MESGTPETCTVDGIIYVYHVTSLVIGKKIARVRVIDEGVKLHSAWVSHRETRARTGFPPHLERGSVGEKHETLSDDESNLELTYVNMCLSVLEGCKDVVKRSTEVPVFDKLFYILHLRNILVGRVLTPMLK